ESAGSSLTSATEAASMNPALDDARPSPYRRILLTPPSAPDIADDNIIEFPRPAEQDALFEHELAEPIFSTPRILDSPEHQSQPEQPVPSLPPLATVHLDDFISSFQAPEAGIEDNFA